MGKRRGIVAAAVVAGILLCGMVLAAPPSAADEVDRIAFTQSVGPRAAATVTVTFDRPVSRATADRLRARVGATRVAQAPTAERLACGQGIVRSDPRGGINLDYVCLPLYANLNWYFRLSPALQTTVVGGIDERGLSWWRNGAEEAQNAPHPGVPRDYLLHGTMTKVWNGDVVDYQDYVSWRHNIGSGGRIAVAFAGSVALG
jgi:hypothetical protein